MYIRQLLGISNLQILPGTPVFSTARAANVPSYYNSTSLIPLNFPIFCLFIKASETDSHKRRHNVIQENANLSVTDPS